MLRTARIFAIYWVAAFILLYFFSTGPEKKVASHIGSALAFTIMVGTPQLLLSHYVIHRTWGVKNITFYRSLISSLISSEILMTLVVIIGFIANPISYEELKSGVIQLTAITYVSTYWSLLIGLLLFLGVFAGVLTFMGTFSIWLNSLIEKRLDGGVEQQ